MLPKQHLPGSAHSGTQPHVHVPSTHHPNNAFATHSLKNPPTAIKNKSDPFRFISNLISSARLLKTNEKYIQNRSNDRLPSNKAQQRSRDTTPIPPFPIDSPLFNEPASVAVQRSSKMKHRSEVPSSTFTSTSASVKPHHAYGSS